MDSHKHYAERAAKYFWLHEWRIYNEGNIYYREYAVEHEINILLDQCKELGVSKIGLIEKIRTMSSEDAVEYLRGIKQMRDYIVTCAFCGTDIFSDDATRYNDNWYCSYGHMYNHWIQLER